MYVNFNGHVEECSSLHEYVPLNFRKPSCTMDSNRIQEDNYMSFVGMVICEDGVLTFGDTRSSKKDELGNFVFEKGREAKKVFSGNDFLLCTWGTNQYHDFYGRMIPIENLISKLVETAIDPIDFLDAFANQVSQNPEDRQMEYCFCIGAKDSYGWYVRPCFVQNGRIGLLPKRRDHYAVYGNRFFTNNFRLTEKLTIHEEMTVLQQEIQCLMDKAERIGTYNPVSFPFYYIYMDTNGRHKEKSVN